LLFMFLAKNSLQKVALIMLRMVRNLVALMLVMGVRGTFKVDLNNTLDDYQERQRLKGADARTLSANLFH